MTPNEILALPFESSDIGPTTVGGYLSALLLALWDEGDGFSGKRPLGNSGWQFDLYTPLVQAGVVRGTIDDDGYLEDLDEDAAKSKIRECIHVLALDGEGEGR